MKQKIISLLKKIGIAILAFLGYVLFKKADVFSSNSEQKKKDEIKESGEKLKTDIEQLKPDVEKHEDIVDAIGVTLESSSNKKASIENASKTEQIAKAKRAGFKKKG